METSIELGRNSFHCGNCGIEVINRNIPEDKRHLWRCPKCSMRKYTDSVVTKPKSGRIIIIGTPKRR